MDLSKTKFRASGAARLVTYLDRITDKQAEEISKLSAKDKLSEIQEKKLNSLIAQRDSPDVLPSGAITFLEEVYDHKKYDILEEIGNKFTEKGNSCEDDSIGLLSDFMDRFMIKNEESKRSF